MSKWGDNVPETHDSIFGRPPRDVAKCIRCSAGGSQMSQEHRARKPCRNLRELWKDFKQRSVFVG